MGKDAVAIAVAILLIFSGRAAAETPGTKRSRYAKPPTIRVTGKGSVQAEPDTGHDPDRRHHGKCQARKKPSRRIRPPRRRSSPSFRPLHREEGPQDLEFLGLCAIPDRGREQASSSELPGLEHRHGYDPRHGQGGGYLDQGCGGGLQPDQWARPLPFPNPKNT